MAGKISKEKLRLIRSRILRWYKAKGRDFLWRRHRDPYLICVSEIMLHQTQASRVEQLLPVFLKQFPSWRSLARAPKSAVVRAWKGLGYNNRAVRLWELSQLLFHEYGGKLPGEIEILQQLPGLGRYSAHAIACFAFGCRVPVVEVNIRRVLSRIFRKSRHALDILPERTVWEISDTILPAQSFEWNQALMELGAVVCRARKPECLVCPVSSLCRSSHLYATEIPVNPGSTKHPEPGYQHTLNRIWRGRIIDALRPLAGGKSLSVEKLGRTVKKDFLPSDMSWLMNLLQKLRNDRLVVIGKNGKTFTVKLAHS